MVFSSLPFLFVFLPAFFLVYGFAPTRWKNALLFVGSVAFYSYGALETPGYIALLLVTIVVNWFAGLRMAPGKRCRKLWLVLGLLYNFFWLLLLWGLVLWMTLAFRKVDPVAAKLQIPYLIWVTFAAYLNFVMWQING